jgi:hypothetical protein
MKERFFLKINHIIFWWYYKRVPEFFRQWTILKSINLFRQNYEHQEFMLNGKDEVISSAIKTERRLQEEITNLKLKLMGVSQEKLDHINDVFGTNMKGKSKEERDN